MIFSGLAFVPNTPVISDLEMLVGAYCSLVFLAIEPNTPMISDLEMLVGAY